jgi:hypothetical protein
LLPHAHHSSPNSFSVQTPAFFISTPSEVAIALADLQPQGYLQNPHSAPTYLSCGTSSNEAFYLDMQPLPIMEGEIYHYDD